MSINSPFLCALQKQHSILLYTDTKSKQIIFSNNKKQNLMCFGMKFCLRRKMHDKIFDAQQFFLLIAFFSGTMQGFNVWGNKKFHSRQKFKMGFSSGFLVGKIKLWKILLRKGFKNIFFTFKLEVWSDFEIRAIKIQS